MSAKRYLCFNINTRAELVLAVKHASFHGFQPRPLSAKLMDAYDGGRCCLIAYFNPLLKENDYRLAYKSNHRDTDQEDDLVVDKLQDFKYALDTFYHDGYLDEDNFKES